MGELAGGFEPVEEVEVEVVAAGAAVRMRGRMAMKAARGIRRSGSRSRCMERVSQRGVRGEESGVASPSREKRRVPRSLDNPPCRWNRKDRRPGFYG